ncbi:MAG: hypothetical protein GWP19_11155 [Planctomycetia bacterium]|nr:hypothetical protein [Planctomycetia bacterium]
MPVSPLYSSNKNIISSKQLIHKPHRIKPHVVLLGAGASKQAFMNGDAKGKKIPLMEDLIEIIGLESDLKNHKISYKNKNFELLYGELYNDNPNSRIVKILEEKVFKYFDELSLPTYPTLYDYLLVSLRPKDVIATFNWDPFLFDAYDRNFGKLPLPQILHLHGNVRVGYCKIHKTFGRNGEFCPECLNPYTPSKLLYPIAEKNYSDEFSNGEWKVLEYHLQKAFTLTIFGYGSPETDKKAFELLANSWKANGRRELETVEIIDIKDEEFVINHWKEFVYSHHYLYFTDFNKSWIPTHPRRSCEAIYVPTFLGKFVEDFSICTESTFQQVFAKLKPLVIAEEKLNKNE